MNPGKKKKKSLKKSRGNKSRQFMVAGNKVTGKSHNYFYGKKVQFCGKNH